VALRTRNPHFAISSKSVIAMDLGSYYSPSIMRRLITAIAVSILFSQIPTPASASLNAPINLENPRVVPIFGQPLDVVSPVAGWSGYLYSPRIVFSAAHSHYKFDNNGNRILSESALITVGKPNSAASEVNGRVKVIKTFVGDFNVSGMNDFIVYVLEKDLVPISTGKLLTPEIEKELVAAQSEVRIHGYGEYQDRCPGQPGPCKKTDFRDPNMRTSELPRSPVGSMKVVAPSYFPWLAGVQKENLANHILLSDVLSCSGDSGGPTTTLYRGEPIYLGTSPSGQNVRACGAGVIDDPTKVLGFLSPVYKHLNLISQAEAFIKENPSSTSTPTPAVQPTPTPVTSTAVKKITITCTKGKVIKKVSGTAPKCPAGYKKK
jgi:hypothetical protein